MILFILLEATSVVASVFLHVHLFLHLQRICLRRILIFYLTTAYVFVFLCLCFSHCAHFSTNLLSCFYRKNASKSWHARNLTASQTHMMMRFLHHHQIRLSRPGAAEEGSVPRSTLKKMLSATYARSALEDGCISKHLCTHKGTHIEYMSDCTCLKILIDQHVFTDTCTHSTVTQNSYY